MFRTQDSSRGYSLVELVVSITVFSIIVIVFGIAVTSAYHEAFASKARSQTTTALQTAMDIIEKDVRYSVEFIGVAKAPYGDIYGRRNTQGANFAWNYNGYNAKSRVLILANYASNQREASSIRRPIYINKPNTFYNCSSQPEYLPKLQYRTVYFVNHGVLYRRILIDTTSPRCPGPKLSQKQSCPASGDR